MEESNRYRLAKKRVVAKKMFYRHLGIYLAIGGFLFLLNVLTSPGSWWFYWPMLGWGVGITIQYFNVFGLGGTGIGTPEWEERELDKEMDRLGGTVPEQSFDIDDHLELDDIKIKKKQPASYQNEDLV